MILLRVDWAAWALTEARMRQTVGPRAFLAANDTLPMPESLSPELDAWAKKQKRERER